MAWLTVLSGIVHYILVPFIVIFNVCQVIFAPATHIIAYTLHALLLPLMFFTKFEVSYQPKLQQTILITRLQTFYIYFGVAALIGLITGSILHFSSTMLITIFDLRPSAEEKGRTAASVREAREKKNQQDAWQSSSSRKYSDNLIRLEEMARKDYSDFLDKDWGKRREGQGLLSQTILEEDDDSEDGF